MASNKIIVELLRRLAMKAEFDLVPLLREAADALEKHRPSPLTRAEIQKNYRQRQKAKGK